MASPSAGIWRQASKLCLAPHSLFFAILPKEPLKSWKHLWFCNSRDSGSNRGQGVEGHIGACGRAERCLSLVQLCEWEQEGAESTEGTWLTLGSEETLCRGIG